MSFRANKKHLLKNYNKIWESKAVYGDDDKYIKTKIKAYAGSMITNF